jgi:RNA polymerase sigma-70 factor (ECF subfamily)
MRVRNGEPQVFALIVERFQQPLRAWLAARCPPELDANEIAQAVMVAAYTRLDDYQIGSDMAAWMWAIARHQLRGEITRLTRQRDVRARHWPVIAYEELLRRCDKDDTSESRLSALSECLKQLSAAARTVLDLRYTRNLDSDAIAEQTGRTSAAIRKQLTIVRRSLHDCITRQDKEVVS